MEALLRRDGRNWTKLWRVFTYGANSCLMNPCGSCWRCTSREADPSDPLIHCGAVVMIKTLEIFPLMGDHAEFQHVLLCCPPVSVVVTSSGVVCVCLKGA